MKPRFHLLSLALAAALAVMPTLALRAQDDLATEDKAAAPTSAAPSADVAPAQPLPPAAPAAPEPVWINRGEVVAIGSNAFVRENEHASKVVAVGGNAEVRGRVDGEVVAVMGDVLIDGPVGKVVAVMGTVTLGPKARVSGEVVAVGGRVDNPHDVPVCGKMVKVAPFLPRVGPLLRWLGDVVVHARLLSPHLAWPWYAFGAGVLFFLLLAGAFGRGVNACARSLAERPGSTLTTALALLPLLPLLTLLLICTGVGILLVPFLLVAVLCAFTFGKVAILAFLGRSVLRAFGAVEAAEQAWLTVLIGAALLAALYCVPVVGLLAWAFTAWVGLGMVAATILENRRRERAVAAVGASAAAAAVAPAREATVAMTEPGISAAAPVEPPPSEVPPVMSAPPLLSPQVDHGFGAQTVPPRAPAGRGREWTADGLPRADFFLRLGALLIDIVLVAIVGGASMAFGLLPFPLLFGAYAFGFWLWRGTTLGGIVFNLKVVRLDGRPVDAATAAVRTFVAFLSAVTLVGFLWCLWDTELQTWHDKVAGTVVVRVPRSTPLV